MKLNYRYIHNILNESISNVLTENKIVTFGNNTTYPNYGQAVFMLGACGAGKSYLINSGVVPINAKTIDLDEIKQKYINLQKNPSTSVSKRDKYQYNLSNGQDLGKLHLKIRHEQWEERIIANLLNKHAHNTDRLPNLIFDKTGANMFPIIDYATMCKDAGYETTLVWVVSSRSRSMWNNINRSRTINQDMFHTIHNDVLDNLPNYIPQEAMYSFDNVWIVFNSSSGLKQMSADEQKDIAIKLDVGKFGFNIPPQLKQRILDVLEPREENVYNPQTYRHFNDVQSDNFKNYGYDYTGNQSYLTKNKKAWN